MLNITVLSLHLLCLTSTSPFYSIHNNYKTAIRSTFYNSHFSHLFSTVIASHSTHHSTRIERCFFSHTLQTPIVFDSAAQCKYGPNLIYDKSIEGKTISQKDFEGWDDKRPYFTDATNCGDITIISCTIDNCYSVNSQGGSLNIEQDSKVVLHSVSFINGHTSHSRGGAAIITKKINHYGNTPNDEKVPQLNVQYCCFSGCHPDQQDNMLGVALFAAGEDTIFSYASTVNCPPEGTDSKRARGAQFDIQANQVRTTNINITGGNSLFTAGIEYRHATVGYFRFQTISKIAHCRFATCYTSVNIPNLELTHSVYDNNNLEKTSTEDTVTDPALVHFRDNDAKIDNFFFTNFKGVSNSYLFSIYGTDGKKVKLTLVNVYADQSCNGKTGNTNNNNNWIDGTVTFPDNIVIPEITQLNLGECKGLHKLPPSMTVEQIVQVPEATATPIPQPVVKTPTKAPEISTPTKEPVTSAPTKAPEISTLTKVPEVSTLTKAPAISKTTKEPAISTPTKVPEVSTPTKVPVISDPTKASVISTPTKVPEASTPTKEPVVSTPTKAAEASTPTKAPIISMTNKEPVTSSSSSTAANNPTKDPATSTSTSQLHPTETNGFINEITAIGSESSDFDIEINENESNSESKNNNNLGLEVGLPVASVATAGAGVVGGIFYYMRRKKGVGAAEDESP